MSFPAQQQQPPGLTEPMTPTPDHGESSYEGHGLAGRPARADHRRRLGHRPGGRHRVRPGGRRRRDRVPARGAGGRRRDRAVGRAGRAAVRAGPDRPDGRAGRARGRADGRDRAGRARRPGEQRRVPDGAPGVDRGHHLARTWTGPSRRTCTRCSGSRRRPWSTWGRAASILNNSSIQAYQPSETLLDYASTKAAINNVTVNLAAELGPRGIRVNAVAPGPIWTPLQPATQFSEKVEKFGADTPLGRAGQPAEVAPAFVFLAAGLDRVLRVRDGPRGHRRQAGLLSPGSRRGGPRTPGRPRSPGR